jgi:hypothetical protein
LGCAYSRALYQALANFSGSIYGSKVLLSQSGLLAIRAHMFGAKWCARNQRQRQGAANNLTAAFAK